MKYSESQDYMRYGVCLARDDFASAAQAIQACLDNPVFQADPGQYADLHQILAGVYSKSGKKAEAVSLHQRAEEVDPKSLYVKYLFAKFLFEQLGDADAALIKCDEIIAAAHEHPFPESNEDFSSEWYVDQVARLKMRATP